VEVVVPVSPWFLFSIPVGLDDDGRGLCVELVLPIPCPAEEFEAPPSPLVSSAKDIVFGPAKRMRATTAARILWGIINSGKFGGRDTRLTNTHFNCDTVWAPSRKSMR
jgi:hypothetical protein